MQREVRGRERRCEEKGKGILRRKALPAHVSPFLSQETPSGFEWKPDLSSLVSMLRWDVPGSLSSSLYSPFILQHKYYLPHVFVCVSLLLFFSILLTFSVSASRPPELSSSRSPVDD